MDNAVLAEQPKVEIFVGISEKKILKVKALIIRVEHLIEMKQFSPELLWCEFFKSAHRELKSYALIIGLLKGYAYPDVSIIQLLKLIGLDDKEIFSILREAGWKDVRIASAIVNLSTLKIVDPLIGALIRIDLIGFLLASEISGSRVIDALFRTDNLTQKCFNDLLQTWPEYYFLTSIIEAGCFNSRVYGIIMQLDDKRGNERFNDGMIFEMLELFKMPDKDIVSTFGGLGKSVNEICILCNHANWSRSRFVDAGIAAGYSPGEIAFCYVANLVMSSKSKPAKHDYMTDPASDKAMVVEIMSALEMSDGGIYKELEVFFVRFGREATDTVGYLIEVGWTSKRILAAMLKSGISEFRITAMLNKFQADFKMKRNKIWTEETVRLWKNASKRLVARDLTAIFG
ncbi:MAG: hypothetical protein WCT26_02420 [Candidatus Buchananbacteria bacterium]|jgi:hypothetical protein